MLDFVSNYARCLLYPQKIKTSGKKAYSTNDIKKMLDTSKTNRNKLLIHLFASTGCRKGAIPDLMIKHLTKMNDSCYCVMFYEDSTEEYVSFLTPESSKALDNYLQDRKNHGEVLNDSSPIFRSNYQIGIEKVKPMTLKSVGQTIERIVNRTNIRAKINKKRHDKMINHAFRKRFETILKLNNEIPIAVSEKLIGHKIYFDERGNSISLDDSYVVPEIEKLFEFFKLAIPQLTIDDKERDIIKIKKLEHEKSKLIETTERLEIMEKKLTIQEKETKWLLGIIGKIKPLTEEEVKKYELDKYE